MNALIEAAAIEQLSHRQTPTSDTYGWRIKKQRFAPEILHF
jgi:hypothetical protein